MTELLRITTAEPVIHGVLKLGWSDGYVGIVDLRAIIAKGDIFRPIRDSRRFADVKVEPFGHSIYWGADGAEDLDFGADSLRELAEEQAALLARAV